MKRVSAFSVFSSKNKKGKCADEDTPKIKVSPGISSLRKTSSTPTVAGESKTKKLLKVLKGGSLRGSFKGSATKSRQSILPDVAMDSPFIPHGGDPDCELTSIKSDSVKKNGSNKPPLPKKPSRKDKKKIQLDDATDKAADNDENTNVTNYSGVKRQSPRNEGVQENGLTRAKASKSSSDEMELSPSKNDTAMHNMGQDKPPRAKVSKGQAKVLPPNISPSAKHLKKKDKSYAEEITGLDLSGVGNLNADEKIQSCSESQVPTVMYDSTAEAKRAFDTLIHPVTKQTFFREMWERKPLLVKRHLPHYNQGLFSTSDLDGILRKENIQFTTNLDIVSYEDDKRETHNPVGRAYAPVVWDYYQNGCSVRLLNPQTYSKSVWTLLAKLQEFFGCSVGANIYLTPPGTQGFAPHYDDIEAFILQLEGKKHWRLYSPRSTSEMLPRFSSDNLSQEDLGTPILDKILEAGDMLYFPRGTIHQGRTCADAHSLHITVSAFQKNTWGDLLQKLLPSALQSAMEENLDFRKGLPLDYLNFMGVVNSDKDCPERVDFLSKMKQLLTSLVSYAPIDAACDQMGKQFVVDSLPPVLSEGEKQCSIHGTGEHWNSEEHGVRGTVEIEPDTHIKLVRKGVIRIITEEDQVRIYHCLENARIFREVEPQYIEIQAEVAPAVEFLIHNYPEYIPVDSLPLDSLEERISIAKDLYEKGLLITGDPLEPLYDTSETDDNGHL
ncbi:ribosomal oxygenase 1-like isoform X2 [Gigantopelta aegis]|uniref:ribosomal oxygenase 1-like isoform X2 n=1 Tax=Gigantopelta aegis TaxID=1735272 RepID=UPI001B8877BF|nr:ribosomal oxygenase 1-like isoform X2 [Gigantopelta aegis]